MLKVVFICYKYNLPAAPREECLRKCGANNTFIKLNYKAVRNSRKCQTYKDIKNNNNLSETTINYLKFFPIIIAFVIITFILLLIYIFTKRKENKNYTLNNYNSNNNSLNINNITNNSNSDSPSSSPHSINYINVAYSLDNDYHYIVHVSMKSIMLSQNPNTFINFYILTSNMNEKQKEVIDKIALQHKNCKIEYLDMGDKFKDLNVPGDTYAVWSTAIFYRLLLQYLLPTEKKILYLDGDTLIYKDLTKIYNYNITDKYYVGMLEYKVFTYARYFKEKFGNYINTGVLLCNLEELRKGNITEKFLEFYKQNNKTIRFPVNDGLNIVSHEKNDYFTPEYVVIGFCNVNSAYNYYEKALIKLNSTAVKEAYKDPYIYHLIYYAKPWREVPKEKNSICVDPFIRFYEMARKTDYYYDILEKFNIKEKTS